MVESKDLFDGINTKIKEIQNQVLLGKINLLDLELVPIFNEIKDSLTINNIYNGSETFSKACILLNQKFQELQILLNSLGNEDKFLEYLESKPEDSEIYQIFEGCWRKIYNIDNLSLNFLENSKGKLSKRKGQSLPIEHLDKTKSNEDFFLELPKQRFTEKMIDFFNKIKSKLPCAFEGVFEEEQDQIKIYENFVYLLHLLQLGKIKYQKDTNFLYI
ncbi:MAG: hypothetical protein ACFFA6_02045 [Promethearchaeota archaeon]